MNIRMRSTVAAVALAALGMAGAAQAQSSKNMSFFVTSVGSGKGADLGGLAGADKHCAELAKSAGAASKTWHAYLSTSGQKAVNARDRIGKGPWVNAKGVAIAKSVDDLHGKSNNLTKETALNEKGEVVNGRGDKPNRHDILTGSSPEGRALPGDQDMTCGNYTKSGTDGAVMMGHHDRQGLKDDDVSKSWNSSHASRGGCGQEALRATGGDGLTYCFAVK
jgi:hypothetical protein